MPRAWLPRPIATSGCTKSTARARALSILHEQTKDPLMQVFHGSRWSHPGVARHALRERSANECAWEGGSSRPRRALDRGSLTDARRCTVFGLGRETADDRKPLHNP
jgi:hypothetical protein